jgi:hypothetical protein
MSAYLLLRDNKKTGPHNFEDLLSMQLGSLDLIWVEGHSQRWKHPAELEDFSVCAFERSGIRPCISSQVQVLPGIRFRLPAYDISSPPWGPIPTLALQGVSHFMAPPNRHRAINLQTGEADEWPSLFSVLPISDRSAWVSVAFDDGLPKNDDYFPSQKVSIRDRQEKATGKGLRRSRKKHPHHLDLSDLLAVHGQPACQALPDGFLEGGFHIEFD